MQHEKMNTGEYFIKGWRAKLCKTGQLQEQCCPSLP